MHKTMADSDSEDISKHCHWPSKENLRQTVNTALHLQFNRDVVGW